MIYLHAKTLKNATSVFWGGGMVGIFSSKRIEYKVVNNLFYHDIQ